MFKKKKTWFGGGGGRRLGPKNATVSPNNC